ncbi:MAG: hypothetical protein JOZ58_16625 [Acetobacteraceae bacterium]|nr:hypothetical protein [Acetobacteraceae bacterium]
MAATTPPPAGPRVVIHFRAGSPADEAQAGRLVAALGREAGSAEIRAVPDAPRTATIRYFRTEDREAAETVARTLQRASGMSWTIRNSTAFRPSPPPGTIEAWIPGR